MIIQENSILNSLPTARIDSRELYYFEVTITIIKMLEINYSRIFEMIESKDRKITQEPLIVEVWSIIDNFYRLKIILDKIPGIKKKEPWFQTMLKKLDSVEKPRHFIEHYDHEIENLQSKTLPPFGYLAYAVVVNSKTIQTMIAVPGYVRKYHLTAINPAGRMFRQKVDLITFFIGEDIIKLSELLYTTIDFVKEFEKYIEMKYK